MRLKDKVALVTGGASGIDRRMVQSHYSALGFSHEETAELLMLEPDEFLETYDPRERPRSAS